MHGDKSGWECEEGISQRSIQELPIRKSVLQKRNEGAYRIYGKRIYESRAFVAEI